MRIMTTAHAGYLFPLPESVEPEVGSFAWMRSEINRLKQLNAKHGAMLTQAQVAVALQVTKGAVTQIVAAGRLPVEEIAGTKYIPADALVTLMREEPSKYKPFSKARLAAAAFQYD